MVPHILIDRKQIIIQEISQTKLTNERQGYIVLPMSAEKLVSLLLSLGLVTLFHTFVIVLKGTATVADINAKSISSNVTQNEK